MTATELLKKVYELDDNYQGSDPKWSLLYNKITHAIDHNKYDEATKLYKQMKMMYVTDKTLREDGLRK